MLLSKIFYTDCVNRNIPVTKDLVVTKLLTDEAQIGEWNIEGLPTDDHSIQNAIMVTRSSKWPLLVDPQGQGLAWLKKRKYSDEKVQFRIARLSDSRLRNVLEECMENGYPLIIENIEEEVDPMLDPVLEKNFLKGAKRKQIVLSDKSVDYDDRFQLFLTTKLANPHYSPELYAKTTVIDFTVTMGGLEQQLLGYV
ncbi:ODA2, partial [Acrasis kona]